MYGDVPYIVASRESEELLLNLGKDNFPILFEGLHSTFHLKNPRLKHRFKMVRTHNVEHDYYHHLEMVEKNFFKRYFFKLESEKLKKYQSILKHAQRIFAISPNDTAYFQKKFGQAFLIPAFHGNSKVTIIEGRGDFVLYHGNLAVGENHEAAMFLIRNVFSKMKLPLVIAGSNPKKELKQLAGLYKNVTLKDDLDSEQILQLIEKAQINILYTAQDTGIKLKLLNALYRGRHCVVNHKMVDNTGLETLCHIADDASEFIKLTETLYKLPFTVQQIKERELYLSQTFENTSNAAKIIELISFEEPEIKEVHPEVIKRPKVRSRSLQALFGLLPL